MTIQEFFRFVPISNDTRTMVVGNGYFNGVDLSSGRFVMADRNVVLNLDKDYELLNVSIYNNALCLEIRG